MEEIFAFHTFSMSTGLTKGVDIEWDEYKLQELVSPSGIT